MTPVSATRIQLAIPGSPDFLRLARLAAADVGSRIGMTFEDLEDLRIAVDELSYAITGGRPESTLNLVFTLGDAVVEVEGTSADEGGPFAPTELARTIVAAVVDDYQLEAAAGQRRFRLTKRVPEG
jgi:anti-sigma regulatory factor (Ser/Thr protein kinase)